MKRRVTMRYYDDSKFFCGLLDPSEGGSMGNGQKRKIQELI